jgi:hypothetical protein
MNDERKSRMQRATWCRESEPNMNEPAIVTLRKVSANTDERRIAPRVAMTCPAKVYDAHSEKYFQGRTGNISDSGALILLQRSMPTFEGATFDVAIARSVEDVVVRRNEMIASTVVRVTPIDHHTQAVAVRFNEASSLARDEARHTYPEPQAA